MRLYIVSDPIWLKTKNINSQQNFQEECKKQLNSDDLWGMEIESRSKQKEGGRLSAGAILT